MTTEPKNVSMAVPDRSVAHGPWRDNSKIHSALINMLIPPIMAGAEQSNSRPSEIASAVSATTLISAKLARIAAGDTNDPDHWLDIAGYARLHHDLLLDNVRPTPAPEK